MEALVHAADFSCVDLVFIDDSTEIDDRVRTIAAVFERVGAATPALIHDFEQQAYVSAARGFRCTFVFDALVPHTGLVGMVAFLEGAALCALNRRIARRATSLEPDDVDAWLQVFPRRIDLRA